MNDEVARKVSQNFIKALLFLNHECVEGITSLRLSGTVSAI